MNHITTGINKPTDEGVASVLVNMTCVKLNALAKKHGSPVRKYKADTAIALARKINAPGRNLTLAVAIKFM